MNGGKGVVVTVFIDWIGMMGVYILLDGVVEGGDDE